VNVGGADYDVTTFTGSYNDSSAKFSISSMPWYGNSALAQDFAIAVGGGLLYPNSPPTPANSPFFAWSHTTQGNGNVDIWYTYENVPLTPYQVNGIIPPSDTYVWAEAVAVPGPVPILGIPVVVAYCRKLKQRIKARRDASSVSSV
jgi:hypothetical protein